MKIPKLFTNTINSERFSGGYIKDSKNAHLCWDVDGIEDCSYCTDLRGGVKDCLDVSYFGVSGMNELCYECEAIGHGVFNIRFSKTIWGGCSNLDYCYQCFNCQDCFGCCSLKKAQYCIFNKPYSKEKYFELREKIMEHMKVTPAKSPFTKGENWLEFGEFFPISMSPFAYNETIAQEYLPLTKAKALARGYNWKDEEQSTKYEGPVVAIPDNISEVQDSICDQILTCAVTGKNYRIVKPELAFYRKMNLPIPKICPDERHRQRMALRNPRTLWERNCDKCGAGIKTTFSPERPERVYCEQCYLEVVS